MVLASPSEHCLTWVSRNRNIRGIFSPPEVQLVNILKSYEIQYIIFLRDRRKIFPLTLNKFEWTD